MFYLPTHYKIISGSGKGGSYLNAFDNALQNSGVGNYNLIRVSSILPPLCEKSASIDVPYGALLPIAYSSIETSKIGEKIVAVIGVGIPKNSGDVGVIMEHSEINPLTNPEQTTKEMVIEAMNNRNIQIEDILIQSCEIESDSEHNCVFAAIAMW